MAPRTLPRSQAVGYNVITMSDFQEEPVIALSVTASVV